MQGFNLRGCYPGSRFPDGHLSTRSTSRNYVLRHVSVDNLKKTLEQATEHDTQLGLESFFKYNRIVAMIAAKTGFVTRVAAAVFSALSPNNDYWGNLRDAHTLLAAARDGLDIEAFTVSTYGNNKRKAWQIAHGAEPLDLIVAKKTRSFFLNVYDPTDPHPVTVDGHMVNIWKRKRENLVGLRWDDKKNYERIADDVRVLARERGVIPSQMQGILWLTWRRIHGIKTDNQLTFWDEDLLAARLGTFLLAGAKDALGQVPVPFAVREPQD